MIVRIKPHYYPMAWVKAKVIGICDTGDISKPEELELFLNILLHEWFHIFLYQIGEEEADKTLDNLPTNLNVVAEK